MTKHQSSSHPADASRRIAELEAINDTLREALSSKNAHIAMLEERLLTMSIELASSRAREDEQNLIIRRKSTGTGQEVSRVSMMSLEDESDNVVIPDEFVPSPVRNMKKNGRRRRNSRSSSVSPCPAVTDSAAIDDSIRSAPAASSSSNRRFSFKPSFNPDLNDSQRSLGSGGGMSGIIGNIFHNLDRSDNSEDLSVDFPSASRRRSSMMSDTDYSSSSCQEPSRRVSMVGSLFGLRKSELSDETVEEASCEYEVEQEEEQQPSSPQRRRPNRSLMANRCQKSTRLISSTVAFPTLDDDDSLGFE